MHSIFENSRSNIEKPASSRMMQGCIIAHDAPPPTNILILLSKNFRASNDLKGPFF